MNIQTKRVYEPASPEDGFRVLVDRVWPRGMTKARLGADLWLKEAAPSTALRNWFGHDPSRWKEFQKRYAAEIRALPDVVKKLLEAATRGRLTLLYSAKETRYNQAVALREYLLRHSRGADTVRGKSKSEKATGSGTRRVRKRKALPKASATKRGRS